MRSVVIALMIAGSAALGGDRARALDLGMFVDPDDGYPDASSYLSQGGFIPVPIILTEPAVEGGLGFMGQFVREPTTPGGDRRRTILGGAVTGNGSYGGGLYTTGSLRSWRMSYSFGLGGADITLPIFPFGGDVPINYDNVIFGGLAAVRFQIGNSDFSAGPVLSYRNTKLSLAGDALGPLGQQVLNTIGSQLGTKEYLGLGGALHYDSRDNPLTPLDGTNAIASVNIFDDSVVSDSSFVTARLTAHSFTSFAEDWDFAVFADLNTGFGDRPFFMAPSVTLRGVQGGRYSGDSAFSAEVELRRQLTPRCAVVGFGGYGETHVDESGIFDATDDIWTYGAGIRYRIARKQGIDVGIDVARGPEDTIVYFQFGHAWMRTMD